MGFLATKTDGTSVRVSVYTREGGNTLFVDSAGNLYETSDALGGNLYDTGRDAVGGSADYDSSGDSSGVGGSLTPIAEATLGAPAASISLPSLSLSAYKQVRLYTTLRGVLSTEGAGDWERAMLRFNGDSAANYIWSTQNQDGTSADNTSGGFINGIFIGYGTGPDELANMWGVSVCDISMPASQYPSVNSQGGLSWLTAALANMANGYWKSTAPITSLSVHANDGTNWLAGSSLALFGVA